MKLIRLKIKEEISWLLGVVVLTGAIGLFIFGNKIFDPTPVDIQLHDTYLIFTKLFLFILIFIGLLATISLLRGIYFRLNNKAINGILTFLLILVFVAQILYLNWVNGMESYLRVLYSREIDQEIEVEVLISFEISIKILWTFLIITGALLVTTAYKTFKSPSRVTS